MTTPDVPLDPMTTIHRDTDGLTIRPASDHAEGVGAVVAVELNPDGCGVFRQRQGLPAP